MTKRKHPSDVLSLDDDGHDSNKKNKDNDESMMIDVDLDESVESDNEHDNSNNNNNNRSDVIINRNVADIFGCDVHQSIEKLSPSDLRDLLLSCKKTLLDDFKDLHGPQFAQNIFNVFEKYGKIDGLADKTDYAIVSRTYDHVYYVLLRLYNEFGVSGMLMSKTQESNYETDNNASPNDNDDDANDDNYDFNNNNSSR